MKLSVIKRLLMESFPADVQKWAGALVTPLNSFLDQVTKALANELTVGDNLKAQVWPVVIEASQAYPVRLSYSLNQKPSAVFVGRIAAQDGSSVPAHSLTWTWYGNSIEITFNSLSSVKYDVTLIALV